MRVSISTRLCLMTRGVRRKLKMGLPLQAVEPHVILADIFRNAFAGKPSTISSPT